MADVLDLGHGDDMVIDDEDLGSKLKYYHAKYILNVLVIDLLWVLIVVMN